MKIHRNEMAGGYEVTKGRIEKCLDLLEKSEDFNEGINWNTEVVPGLSVERMIYALIAAEQELK